MPDHLPALSKAASTLFRTVFKTIEDVRYISGAVSLFNTNSGIQQRAKHLQSLAGWFGPREELLIDADVVLRVLFNVSSSNDLSAGPWRPDAIFSKANLALATTTIFSLNPLNSDIAGVLRFLDEWMANLVLLELAGFTEVEFASNPALREAVTAFFLALRVQTLIAYLRSSPQTAEDFSSIIEDFFLSPDSRGARHLLSDAAQNAVEGLDAEILHFARSVNDTAAASGNQVVNVDYLAQSYPWDNFCATLFEMLVVCDRVFSHAMNGTTDETIASRLRSQIERHKMSRLRQSSGLRFSKDLVEQARQANATANQDPALEAPVPIRDSRINYAGSGRKVSGAHYDDTQPSQGEANAPEAHMLASTPQLLASLSSAPAPQSATQDAGYADAAGPSDARQDEVRRTHNRHRLEQRKRTASDSQQSPRKRADRGEHGDEEYVDDGAPRGVDSDEESAADASADMEEPPSTRLEYVRALAKQQTENRPTKHQERNAFSSTEEDRILQLVAKYGAKYSMIKKRDQASLNVLATRDQEAIRHKCRNMKFTFLKANWPLPTNFEQVKLDKKFKVSLAKLGIEYEQDAVRERPGRRDAIPNGDGEE